MQTFQGARGGKIVADEGIRLGGALTRRFLSGESGAANGALGSGPLGSGAGSIGPADRELSLQPDLTGLAGEPTYRLEIVDQTGRPLRLAALARTQGSVTVPGLGAGLYFVRLYLPAGNLLREYGLEIR